MLSLIARYLWAGVMVDGAGQPTPWGNPQGGPVSSLLASILPDDLDKELERGGHGFVCYVVVCSSSSVMMLGWEIGIRTGWRKSLGSRGKHTESLLTPEMWDGYRRTCVDFDYDDLWESLLLLHTIFKRSAGLVAEKRGFRFPRETADKVLAFTEHVRTLPTGSQRIY